VDAKGAGDDITFVASVILGGGLAAIYGLWFYEFWVHL
jgi:hypothetical protein